MSWPFSLQCLSSQLNTTIFTPPLQFTNHRDTTVVFKTKNQLPTCNHHGLLLSTSLDSNQCRSPLLRRDGGAILKLFWRQGLAAAHPSNPVRPCLVTAKENKIDPKIPHKTNKIPRNLSPGTSDGKINESPQQDQVSNEMKTASKQKHDHVLLGKNSLNDHLNRINGKINELKNHADLLKGELDKLLSYSNAVIRTADQSYVVNRDQNKRKANEEAENSSPGGILNAEDLFGIRSSLGKNRKRRGSPDDTDFDTRSAKRTRQE